MKILVVTYSGNISGGANSSMLGILEYLKKKYNYSFKVILPFRGTLVKELDLLDIDWEIHPFSLLTTYKDISVVGILKYFWMYIRCFNILFSAKKESRKLQSENFDLVYTNEFMCFYGAFLAFFLHIPHVWHFRSDSSNVWMPFYSSFIFSHLNGKIVAISRYIKDYFICKYKIKNKVILNYNGVGVTPPQKFSLHPRKNGFHIIHCGRINPMKQHLLGIKAVQILIKKGYKDIYLHIVGSLDSSHNKEYYENLQKYLVSNNLEKNIIFEGQKTDVTQFRSKMNLEIVPSFNEPFGRVTIEAMHNSLIVIGSDSGGTIDIITNNDNGILFKSGDHVDLAKKIEMVYTDENLANKISESAFLFVQSHFTVEQNSEKMHQIFKSLN